MKIKIEEIYEAINSMKDQVIVKASADIFGMRVKRRRDEMPWITTEIEEILQEYEAFMFKWNNLWSTKKKRYKQKRKEELENKKLDITQKAHYDWIQNIMLEDNSSGNMP